MPSPFEQRILDRLATESDPQARALLRVELACYWARVGEDVSAENERQALRQEFAKAASPRVSILLMVLEGLQAYYGRLDPTARDRLMRASLLSKSFNDPGLVALTSAWLAHIDFNQARFDSAIKELLIASEAVRRITVDAGSIRCRIALTLGDANMLTGRIQESQDWYEVARLEAVELRDHAALGAMTYNCAALRVARARFDDAAGLESGIDRSLLRVTVDTAVNYQSAARLKSLEHLLTTTKASLLVYQHRFDDAITIIEQLLTAPEVVPGSVQRRLLEADLALALASSGCYERARQVLADFASTSSDKTSIPFDDAALIAASLASAFRQLGDHPSADIWQSKMERACDEHQRVCDALSAQLSQFVAIKDRWLAPQ